MTIFVLAPILIALVVLTFFTEPTGYLVYKLICKLFGHKPPSYGHIGEEYGELELGTLDGIGRQHLNLFGNCPRCGERYLVMKAYAKNQKRG